MNSDRDHPLMGMCIVIFLLSMALLTLCAPLFEQYPWISSRLFVSLILTVLGGLLLSLRARLARLEQQVRFLREQLDRLERD